MTTDPKIGALKQGSYAIYRVTPVQIRLLVALFIP
jgi:hypothetical protein